MSNVAAIRAPEPQAELVAVPLAELYLSDLNPRQDVDPEGIALLADSIRLVGLMQNLAGLRDQSGRVGIVAGGRRLRALQSLAESHPHLVDTRPELIAPQVKIAPDLATAQAWASVENAAREDLHPADEIRAYGRMAETNAPVETIARVFAKTEAHVRRRLALANLPTPVLDALRAGEISLGTAKLFTLSNDESLTLRLLEDVRGRDVTEWQMKRALQPDAIKLGDRRAIFVGVDAYEAEGGRITRDLFSEDVYLSDPAILDDHFEAKLDAAARRLTDEHGWKWAETSAESFVGWERIDKLDRLYPVEGDLSEEQAERYDELADLANAEALDENGEAELATLQSIADGAYSAEQKAHAGVIVYVDRDGALQACEGLVRREDRVAAIEAGVVRDRQSSSGGTDDAPKSPYSGKMVADLHAIALGARQHAALDQADLILDLLAFQLSGGMGYRAAFELRTDAPANAPETETGYALDERLTKPGSSPRDPWGSDLAKAFRAFRKKGREHRDAELTRHLARLLNVTDTDLGKLIDKEAKTSLRAVWTPTAENFFGRMKGDWLDALWRELLDLRSDHPTATTFCRLKKREKAERLQALFANPTAFEANAEQAAKIAAWLPDHFA